LSAIVLSRHLTEDSAMGSNLQKAIAVMTVLAAMGAGLGAGYAIWGWPTNWYAGHDVASLPPGPQTDLIRYGRDLVADTARHIARALPIRPSATPATISIARIATSTAASSRSAFRWYRPSRRFP
jgi:hypothetical protein